MDQRDEGPGDERDVPDLGAGEVGGRAVAGDLEGQEPLRVEERLLELLLRARGEPPVHEVGLVHPLGHGRQELEVVPGPALRTGQEQQRADRSLDLVLLRVIDRQVDALP